MARIIEDPIDLWRGTEPTITCKANIDGGGTGRAFVFRIGRLNASAYLEKTMTETNNTATSVDLSVALTALETDGITRQLVDFQILSDNPIDVILEGKFKMRGIIRA